jgi:hypothetical protein
MKYPRSNLLFTSLALLLSSQIALASPPQDKPGKSGQAGESNHKYGQTQHGNKRAPKIDEPSVRRIFGENRQSFSNTQSLPPGIAKKLARGKPLPPGIAKNFDSSINNRLPRYPGYEWKQVGTDAVLIDATTQVVYEILNNVLQ